MSDDNTATIKYNMGRGNIGIYKRLPANVLFSWTSNAIKIILDEVEQLKGKPAEEIFKEMGIPLKWSSTDMNRCNGLNWLLTQILAASNSESDFQIAVDMKLNIILDDINLFDKIPKIYCSDCETDETPICKSCNKPLDNFDFNNKKCKCGAPLSYTCPEMHTCQFEQRYWYFPKRKLIEQLNKQIKEIYKDDSLDYYFCIIDEMLYISYSNDTYTAETEVKYSDVTDFAFDSEALTNREDTIKIKEKCHLTCSNKNIDKCLFTNDMKCLPKLFYKVISGFRPQPHGVTEYGDISGQIKVGKSHYEMKGIIKSNTENKSQKTTDDMVNTHLKSTSKAGEEMIRQFIEQGMSDCRCNLIAVIAPQYFDNGLKGTFRYLAKLCGKKVIFLELDELNKIHSLHIQNNKY